MKSTDRGRTWTSIAGDLPARSGAWAIVQDHVDADLLFVGLEFGVYVTVDGGGHWVQLAGGIPTIQARDLAIHQREGDLVVGTFGRGAYILDDYTALRDITPAGAYRARTPVPTARRISVQRAETGRSSVGRCRDTQSAVRRFVHLQPRTTGSVPVRSSCWRSPTRAAKQLRRLEMAPTPGLHRVAWDLRGETPPAAQAGERGGRSTRTVRRTRTAGGPPASAGRYRPRSARSRETRSPRMATRSRSSSFR